MLPIFFFSPIFMEFHSLNKLKKSFLNVIWLESFGERNPILLEIVKISATISRGIRWFSLQIPEIDIMIGFCKNHSSQFRSELNTVTAVITDSPKFPSGPSKIDWKFSLEHQKWQVWSTQPIWHFNHECTDFAKPFLFVALHLRTSEGVF